LFKIAKWDISIRNYLICILYPELICSLHFSPFYLCSIIISLWKAVFSQLCAEQVEWWVQDWTLVPCFPRRQEKSWNLLLMQRKGMWHNQSSIVSWDTETQAIKPAHQKHGIYSPPPHTGHAKCTVVGIRQMLMELLSSFVCLSCFFPIPWTRVWLLSIPFSHCCFLVFFI
jgi:hypothetical protein